MIWRVRRADRAEQAHYASAVGRAAQNPHRRDHVRSTAAEYARRRYDIFEIGMLYRSNNEELQNGLGSVQDLVRRLQEPTASARTEKTAKEHLEQQQQASVHANYQSV
uniref:Transposase n=1 Tax=Macrostomum lignano TaxID=282301 RepID=A0A1I8JR43_9PLAT